MPLQKVPELIARKRAHCIDGLSAEALLADPGYDSNELTDKAVESGCQPVIPPRKNRKSNAIMTRLCSVYATWSRTPFFTSRDGVASPRVYKTAIIFR